MARSLIATDRGGKHPAPPQEPGPSVAIASEYADRQQAFFDFVLGHYVRQGVREPDIEHLGTLLKLRSGNSLLDAIEDLGGVEATRMALTGFELRLYEPLTAA